MPQYEPAGWSSLIATETDCWTGMAPAMLMIALGFGTGLIMIDSHAAESAG